MLMCDRHLLGDTGFCGMRNGRFDDTSNDACPRVHDGVL